MFPLPDKLVHRFLYLQKNPTPLCMPGATQKKSVYNGEKKERLGPLYYKNQQ